jgi:uncharacterized protein
MTPANDTPARNTAAGNTSAKNTGEGSPTPQVIQAYGDGGFTVSGVRHEGPAVVLRNQTLPWSPPDDLAALTTADFAPVLGPAAVEIVLLGCGRRAALVPADLRAALRAAGVSLEAMDTGAACRTFNLLQIEGRRVAAMLVAIS